ncbi:MAG TPA: tripartite tricarboxylate transporter TctB family protein [Rhodanobacter sp.]
MRRADVVFGVIVTVLGAGALVMALYMPFLSATTPGPGFFPRLVASGLVILGLMQIRQGFRPLAPEVRPVGPVSQLEKTVHGKASPREPGKAFLARRPLIVLAGYIVSVPLFGVLGFVVTTTILMAFLLLYVEKRRNLGAYVCIVAIPVATWLLFVELLGMELPNGMLHLGMLGI